MHPKNFLRGLKAACVVAGLVATSSLVHATSLGVDYTGNANDYGASGWNLGWSFQANSNVFVTGLGNWAGAAFPQDQQVGLWDAGGHLLASAYVSNSSTRVGNWLFTTVAPVQLLAGQTYVVGGQGGADYTGVIPQSQLTFDPSISYITDLYVGVSGSSPLVEPTYSENLPYGWFGGNLELSATAAVPVPSSLSLFAGGLAGLLFLLWRKERGQSETA